MKSFYDETINIRFIEDFVNYYSGSAHIKDIESGKYLFSNTTNVNKLGFSAASDIYGLTVHDIDRQMCHSWGDLALRIEHFEQAIQADKKVIFDSGQLSVLPDGFLALHNMKKFPLLNTQGKAIAVVTTSDLVTQQIELLKLFEYYQQFFYTQPLNFIINKFLNYLQIRRHFTILPTPMELKILLCKQRFRKSKIIANSLCLSVNTVETHLYHLRGKINLDLDSVLIQINPVDYSATQVK